MDIVGALDIIGEVNLFLSFQLRISVLEVNFFLDFPLRRFSYIMYATTEDVVDLQVCGDDAAKDFSEKELVDRWATAIQTKRYDSVKSMLPSVIPIQTSWPALPRASPLPWRGRPCHLPAKTGWKGG